MGRNPIVAVIAVIVLIVAVVLILKGTTGSDAPRAGDSVWYDTGTGELYGGPKGVLAPAPAPSGKEGVTASIFSKGSCENKADRFIGYLSKYTEEGKTLMKEGRAEVPMNIAKLQEAAKEQRLIRREKDTEWVIAGSEEGQEIIGETTAKGTRVCTTFLD